MNAIETIILLIDDDLIANFYNQKVILKIQPTAKVISFEGAKMALDYLNQALLVCRAIFHLFLLTKQLVV